MDLNTALAILLQSIYMGLIGNAVWLNLHYKIKDLNWQGVWCFSSNKLIDCCIVTSFVASGFAPSSNMVRHVGVHS